MHPQAGSSREKNVNEEPDRLWGVREVAKFLGVPATTLYQWRYQGYGPPGARVGRYLRYDPRDVRAWFRSLSDGAA
jgi:predicted DNA-binding transcriptional regulator AlpA